MKIKRFEFNMFPVNCYVVSDETREAVVIDPGCHTDAEKQALHDYIERNGLTLKHLLCTHLHLDHIFGSDYVVRTYGLKLEANQADEFLLEKAPQHSRMFGVEWKGMPAPVGHYLHDGDTIAFGHTRLEAIHVPGHSPGSLVFHCPEEKCIFSGDVLFQGSIGRADLAGGNFDELRDSICSRLFCLPDDTVVYPGHGASTSIGAEKRDNPFFR